MAVIPESPGQGDRCRRRTQRLRSPGSSRRTDCMQGYVDEFAFRLNEGNVKEATLGRIGALLDKSVGARLTYVELVGR